MRSNCVIITYLVSIIIFHAVYYLLRKFKIQVSYVCGNLVAFFNLWSMVKVLYCNSQKEGKWKFAFFSFKKINILFKFIFSGISCWYFFPKHWETLKTSCLTILVYTKSYFSMNSKLF